MKALRSLYQQFVVLIICSGETHPVGIPRIRYLFHGHNEWMDSPSMADYLKVKQAHPEYRKDVVVMHGYCEKCGGKR